MKSVVVREEDKDELYQATETQVEREKLKETLNREVRKTVNGNC